MAAALGIGLGVGDVAISLGTSGTVYTVSPTATHDPEGFVAGFADASGRYLPLVCTLNATKVTDTVAGWLGVDARRLRRARPIGRPGRHAARVVPYFDGERTPNLPTATGSVHGLRPLDQRADIARAAHLGCCAGCSTDATSWHAPARRSPVRCASSEAVPTLRPTVSCSPTSSVRRSWCPPSSRRWPPGRACRPPWSPVAGSAAEVVERWRLGEGIDVAPRPGVDGSACRAAYAAALTGMTATRSEAMMAS